MSASKFVYKNADIYKTAQSTGLTIHYPATPVPGHHIIAIKQKLNCGPKESNGAFNAVWDQTCATALAKHFGKGDGWSIDYNDLTALSSATQDPDFN